MAKTSKKKANQVRKEKDFVTEILYLPRKKSRVLTIACLIFVYFVFAPRLIGHLEVRRVKEAPTGFQAYRQMILEIAREQGVNPALVAAMIQTESDFRPHIVSPAGAAGLMQLMPATARSLNVKNIKDPRENIRGGTKYIKSLIGQYRGNLSLAIAAYNAGPGNVKKHGGIPPFKETRNYVVRVKRSMRQYKKYF